MLTATGRDSVLSWTNDNRRSTTYHYILPVVGLGYDELKSYSFYDPNNANLLVWVEALCKRRHNAVLSIACDEVDSSCFLQLAPSNLKYKCVDGDVCCALVDQNLRYIMYICYCTVELLYNILNSEDFAL
jgi:hypothetical protein